MTRFALRFAVVLLAVLIALPAGLEAGLDAGARQGKGEGTGRRGVRPQAARVVTRSFENAGAIAVPAPNGTNVGPAAPYPSQIAVSGLAKGKVVDVNLELRALNHGWTDDLDLLLVAPGGRAAVVMSDAGGENGATGLTLTLDDEAAAALPDATALAAGSFRPTDHDSTAGDRDAFPAPARAASGAVALASFDGIDPNGTWSLFAVDDETLFNGSFAGGWKLTIEAKVKKGGGNGKGNGGGKENGKGGGKGGGRGDKGKGR